MGLPAWVQNQPPWAVVALSLLAAFVGLTALSMLLGIVFAGIALGLEFGSLTLGFVTAFLGLAVVIGPLVVVAKALSSADTETETGTAFDAPTDPQSQDPVETLRAQYVAGELDEETFERRLNALLAESDRTGERERTSDSSRDEQSLLEDRE